MPPSNFTALQGQIERITYTNDETSYTVAKIKVYGHRDLVTVIGAIVNPTPGEVIRMKGEWGHHPKYREQFKIVFCETKIQWFIGNFGGDGIGGDPLTLNSLILLKKYRHIDDIY
jgi:hypothetical protein